MRDLCRHIDRVRSALQRIEEICQREGDFREISVAGDRAGLLVRRIIARRAQQEA